jgi:hypothetical protein
MVLQIKILKYLLADENCIRIDHLISTKSLANNVTEFYKRKELQVLAYSFLLLLITKRILLKI